MRIRLTLLLCSLVIASLACNAIQSLTPGADTPTQIPAGTPANLEDLPPAATEPVTPPTAPPTSAPEPTATESAGAAAPAGLLDLADPALFPANPPAYAQHWQLNFSGIDLSGQPAAVQYDVSTAGRTTPDIASQLRVYSNEAGTEDTFEYYTLYGAKYYIFENECQALPILTGVSPQDFIVDLNDDLTGQAVLVEQNVTVNGILSNHYELVVQNLDWEEEAELQEFRSGSLYTAVDGGYLVQAKLELVLKAEITGLDPNQPVDAVYVFDQTLPDPAELVIELPADCPQPQPTQPVSGDVQAELAKVPAGLPMPAAGQISALSVTETEITLTASVDYFEMLLFYQVNMPLAGWVQDDLSVDLTQATLSFSKGGESVQMVISASGEASQVVITFP